MIITDISEQKGKCRVSLNDDPAFWLYKKELSECELHVGEELSDEKRTYIYQEIIGKRAKKYCLKLLEIRDYTCAQLKEKMRKADYPQEIIEDAAAYVASFHYIDDFRYACAFIEKYKTTKSKQYIQGMLLGKGVASDTISMAMEEAFSQGSEDAIRYWIDKKGFDSEQASEEERTKFIQFMMRKGFSYFEIKKVL